MLTSSVAFYFIFGTTYSKLCACYTLLRYATPRQAIAMLCETCVDTCRFVQVVVLFSYFISFHTHCIAFARFHFISFLLLFFACFIHFFFLHPCKLLTDLLLSLYGNVLIRWTVMIHTYASARVCVCVWIYNRLCMLFFLTSHILISSVFRAFAITLASLNFIAVFSLFFSFFFAIQPSI